jgi:hypothetical protein
LFGRERALLHSVRMQLNAVPNLHNFAQYPPLVAKMAPLYKSGKPNLPGLSHSETSVPIAKRAIKIVRGADQCKVCEGLWKIPKCLALRASLFCKQPEVIGVSQHALEDQTGLI